MEDNASAKMATHPHADSKPLPSFSHQSTDRQSRVFLLWNPGAQQLYC
jgi:hypothetical protein